MSSENQPKNQVIEEGSEGEDGGEMFEPVLPMSSPLRLFFANFGRYLHDPEVWNAFGVLLRKHYSIVNFQQAERQLIKDAEYLFSIPIAAKIKEKEKVIQAHHEQKVVQSSQPTYSERWVDVVEREEAQAAAQAQQNAQPLPPHSTVVVQSNAPAPPGYSAGLSNDLDDSFRPTGRQGLQSRDGGYKGKKQYNKQYQQPGMVQQMQYDVPQQPRPQYNQYQQQPQYQQQQQQPQQFTAPPTLTRQPGPPQHVYGVDQMPGVNVAKVNERQPPQSSNTTLSYSRS